MEEDQEIIFPTCNIVLEATQNNSAHCYITISINVSILFICIHARAISSSTEERLQKIGFGNDMKLKQLCLQGLIHPCAHHFQISFYYLTQTGTHPE